MAKVMTVLGPIAPEEMGITQPHEHLLCDLYEVTADYKTTLEDEQRAIEELTAFKENGGGTIVDVTNIGIARNPLGLQRISRALGVHVVMGSAWYREPVYPAYIQTKSADELAEMIVRDLTEGVDGTGVRAGIIGEIGTERHFITPAQEKVFRAAARAHHRTGVAITTHCTHLGELAMEQLALLRDEGVDPGRIIIGHMGSHRTIERELPVVQAGAYAAFDHVGFTWLEKDWVRAQCIAELITQGYVERILLALDICGLAQLAEFGGVGYGYLLTHFVPMLKKAGVTDEQVHTMLVENPRRILAY